MKGPLTFADILSARGRIEGYVRKTPVLRSGGLNRLAGAQLFFKAENLQKVGAFKFRGATNAVQSLTDEEAVFGVATHSSGNHAQALARAARARAIPAYIVMPEDAPAVKRAAVAGYGGRITTCQPTLEAREKTLDSILGETGAHFVHPYDDPRVIAGQGTATLEFLEQVPDLDMLIAPIGGGGLLSGAVLAATGLRSSLEIYGAEPELADDAFRSFKSGTLQMPMPSKTVADGLRTALSERTFGILRGSIKEVLLASEQEILEAMKLLWERLKTVVEPSGAVGFAAALRARGALSGRKIGIILSGGNVDVSRMKDYFGGR